VIKVFLKKQIFIDIWVIDLIEFKKFNQFK
jgi:hypothetical protein